MGLNFNALKKINEAPEEEVKNELIFDEAEHKYIYLGKVIPSVTQILKEVGASPDMSGINPYYAQRGTALHKAIELWHNERLDEDTLHEDIKPFFDSFMDFVAETPSYRSEKQEQRFCDGVIAGTVDDICEINGKRSIIDYKTSSAIHPHYFLQLGAYMLLSGIDNAYILQLGKNNYKLVSVDISNKDRFRKCVDIYLSYPEDERKKYGSRIVKNQVDIENIRAKSKMDALIRAKEAKELAEKKYKEAQEAVEDKLLIEGVRYSGIMENDDTKIQFTLIPETLSERYDRKLLEKYVDENILEKCKVTSEKKAYYRLNIAKKTHEPDLQSTVTKKKYEETQQEKIESSHKTWDGGEYYTKLIQDLQNKGLDSDQKEKIICFIEELSDKKKEELDRDEWGVWYHQIASFNIEQLAVAVSLKTVDIMDIDKVLAENEKHEDIEDEKDYPFFELTEAMKDKMIEALSFHVDLDDTISWTITEEVRKFYDRIGIKNLRDVQDKKQFALVLSKIKKLHLEAGSF